MSGRMPSGFVNDLPIREHLDKDEVGKDIVITEKQQADGSWRWIMKRMASEADIRELQPRGVLPKC